MVPLADSHPPGAGDPPPPPPPGRTGVVEALGRFLSGPTPRLLIVDGPPGSGKSSLLRAIAGHLSGPKLLVAYRVAEPAAGEGLPFAPTSAGVSVFLVDTEGIPPEAESKLLAAVPAAFRQVGPASRVDLEGLPEGIARGIAAMVALGSGCLVIDEWDRSRQGKFVRDGTGTPRQGRLGATASELTEALAQVPVNTAVGLLGPTSAALRSMADGVVHLGFVDWAGPPVRLLTVEKLSSTAGVEPRYLFTLEGGSFQAPPPTVRAVPPPIPPCDDDPQPTPEELWPGTAAFAEAFGRLRVHGLTGLELARGVPNSYAEPFWMPLAAHTLRVGGRAVVIPPVTNTPSTLCAQLDRLAPGAAAVEGLRVLSPIAEPASRAIPAGVVLRPTGRTASEPAELSGGSIAPHFPEAYEFLAGTPAGKPALYLIALDGLRALAAVSGLYLDPRTLPLLIQSYAQLPGFHACGVSREDEPLNEAFKPSLDARFRLELRDGQLLVYAADPPGRCFLADWTAPGGRYRLLKAA